MEGNYFGTPWRLQQGGLLDLGPHVLDALDVALGTIIDVQAAGDPLGTVVLDVPARRRARQLGGHVRDHAGRAGGLQLELFGRSGRLRARHCVGRSGRGAAPVRRGHGAHRRRVRHTRCAPASRTRSTPSAGCTCSGSSRWRSTALACTTAPTDGNNGNDRAAHRPHHPRRRDEHLHHPSRRGRAVPGGVLLHGRTRQARRAARHGPAHRDGRLLRGAAQPVLPLDPRVRSGHRDVGRDPRADVRADARSQRRDGRPATPRRCSPMSTPTPRRRVQDRLRRLLHERTRCVRDGVHVSRAHPGRSVDLRRAAVR